jgi:hypothetical protein
MIDIDPRQQKVAALEEEGRHAEALALLQELYAETEAEPAPDRTRYFMTMFQWGLLTQHYPPACSALATVRDEQAARLLAGDLYAGTEGSKDGNEQPWERVSRYSLIIEMNSTLGEPHATRDLFLQLEAAQPELAQRYAWQALPAIVEAGDFSLADRYRKEPLEQLVSVNENARSMPLFPPPGQAPRLVGDLSNLVKDVHLGAAVLDGLGRQAEASALRQALLAGLQDEALRALAQRELDEPGTIIREFVARQMEQEDMARG